MKKNDEKKGIDMKCKFCDGTDIKHLGGNIFKCKVVRCRRLLSYNMLIKEKDPVVRIISNKLDGSEEEFDE